MPPTPLAIFRWRSENTLGYERTRDALGAPNGVYIVSRPLMGDEYWDVGAMVSYQRRVFKNINLRVQLNVQNLPNWQDARLVKSDSDTLGVYGTTSAYVPVLWELRRPRNFVLTSTFEF
jgi:outer membrane receptor for monomeric catechols